MEFCVSSMFYIAALQDNWCPAIMVFIWNSYYSMLTSHCMIVGFKVKQDGKKTAALVHKIIHNEVSKIYSERLKKISQQIVDFSII